MREGAISIPAGALLWLVRALQEMLKNLFFERKFVDALLSLLLVAFVGTAVWYFVLLFVKKFFPGNEDRVEDAYYLVGFLPYLIVYRWVIGGKVVPEDEQDRRYWEGFWRAVALYGERVSTVKTSIGPVDLYRLGYRFDIVPAEPEKIKRLKEWRKLRLRFIERKPRNEEEAKKILKAF